MDKLAVIDSLFSVPRALIGVVHLHALPGTPKGKLDIRAITSIAVQEGCEYEASGFHGLMIENTHDRPYLKAAVGPEIVAAMGRHRRGSTTRRRAAAWRPGTRRRQFELPCGCTRLRRELCAC